MFEVRKATVELDRRAAQWVVVECPFCGVRGKHRHGADVHVSDEDLAKSLGNRVPHCDGSVNGTYDLHWDGDDFEAQKVPKLTGVVREQVKLAAKASGMNYREWIRDYGLRTTPLSEDEAVARGLRFGHVMGW